jgi:hypothetical protein
MIYTGIGSRNTPDKILDSMQDWAIELNFEFDAILRSGAAPGADAAFEEGCDKWNGRKEIFLPWRNFQKNPSTYYNITNDAMKIAAEFHDAWKYLKQPVKLLMARNVYQVLGMYLDRPSDFVVCWTPDGCINRNERTKETGGTGQAIAIASEYGIPVFNLQRENANDEIETFLENYDKSPKVPKR